jgi:hypothetical protein
MRSRLLTATLISLALLPPALRAPVLRAQEAPSPSGPPPASDAPPPPDDSATTTLNVQVNLVNLYFSARDRDGFVTNLRKDDCAVTDFR